PPDTGAVRWTIRPRVSAADKPTTSPWTAGSAFTLATATDDPMRASRRMASPRASAAARCRRDGPATSTSTVSLSVVRGAGLSSRDTDSVIAALPSDRASLRTISTIREPPGQIDHVAGYFPEVALKHPARPRPTSWAAATGFGSDRRRVGPVTNELLSCRLRPGPGQSPPPGHAGRGRPCRTRPRAAREAAKPSVPRWP